MQCPETSSLCRWPARAPRHGASSCNRCRSPASEQIRELAPSNPAMIVHAMREMLNLDARKARLAV